MNRPKDPALRRRLLERAAQYVLRHGVGGLSLRPLAKEIGTTARMLIHHFGSKETLVTEVLLAMEQNARQAASDTDDSRSVHVMLSRMWDDIAAPRKEHALRAMFEVWGQALVHPDRYQSYLESLTEPWIELLQRRFEQSGRKAAEAAILATLAVGAFQGLQLVRLTSGEGRRSEAALRMLLQWLDPPSVKPLSRARRKRSP
jgi:AcrR family transcriptional regulator